MPRSANPTATSPLALESRTAPTPARLSAEAMGSGADRTALNKLNAAIGELKALAVQPLLQSAVNALRKEDHQRGAEWAIKALEQDEHSGFAWYLRGMRGMAKPHIRRAETLSACRAIMLPRCELSTS